MQLLTGHAVRVVIDPGESAEVVNRGPGVIYYGVGYGTSPGSFDGTIAAGGSRTVRASTWLATDRDSTTVDIGDATLTATGGGSSVVHGADPNVARPDAVSVTWIGSVRPLNMTAADVWVDTATAAGTVTGLWKPTDCGLVGSTFDAGLGGAAFNLVRGTVHVGRMPLADTNTISSLEVHITGAGVALATSFAGVWSLAGALLATTADQSALWTSTGVKTMALTAPVTVTGDVLVGVLCVTATTVPAMMFTNNYASAAGLNRGLSSPAYRASTQGSQTAPPATLAPSPDTRTPWIGAI